MACRQEELVIYLGDSSTRYSIPRESTLSLIVGV